MGRLFSLFAATVLAGCITTSGAWKEEKASARLLDKLPPYSSATFTLEDGRKERVDSVRDFGDAICGSSSCVRKADVASVYYQPQKVHVLGTLAMIPITGLVVAACATGCNPAPPGDYKAVGPRATPEQQARAWLDSLTIHRGVITFDGDANPCVGDEPSAIRREFATDREALDWIIANRREVSNVCLTNVADHLVELDRVANARTHREMVTRLDALNRIRGKWNVSRCQAGQDISRARFAMERVAPAFRYALENQRGDPMELRILEETLNDTTIYAHDGDLATVCPTGVRPRELWPDLPEWIAAHSPFAPAPDLPPLQLLQ